MPPSAGPGLKKALAVARSCTVRALSWRNVRCAPVDSHWKTPMVSARASRSPVAGSSSGMVSSRKVGSRRLRQLGRVGQHGQGADAQQVDLGQADGLHVAVVVLGDQKALDGPLHRHDIGQRAGGDHQAAGVDAQVVGLANDAGRVHQHLAQARVVHLHDDLLQRLLGAAARIGMPAGRQQLDQPLGLGVAQAVGLGGLAHRRLGAQRADGADQRHVLLAVGAAHVVQHPVAAAAAEVQVDVGRVGARRVEEALEEQVVLDGIDGGDARAVGDQRVGHAAARADRDVVRAGVAHDVGHHQEEGAEAVAGDGVQLTLQALGRWLRAGCGP